MFVQATLFRAIAFGKEVLEFRDKKSLKVLELSTDDEMSVTNDTCVLCTGLLGNS